MLQYIRVVAVYWQIPHYSIDIIIVFTILSELNKYIEDFSLTFPSLTLGTPHLIVPN